MQIKKNNFIKINGYPVSVDIKLFSNKINLILGENGIGKSSFLKGILKEGFKGSFCFQERLVSINSIKVNGLLQTLKKNSLINNEIIDDLLEQFNLRSCLDKEINHLSGGENQSLKIVINFARKDKVLIFDEPSQYLDEKNVKNFSELVAKNLNDKIILIVEHNYDYLSHLELKFCEMKKNQNRIELKNV